MVLLGMGGWICEEMRGKRAARRGLLWHQAAFGCVVLVVLQEAEGNELRLPQLA